MFPVINCDVPVIPDQSIIILILNPLTIESGQLVRVCYVNTVLHAPCLWVFVMVSLAAINKTGFATTSRDTTDYDLSGLYS